MDKRKLKPYSSIKVTLTKDEEDGADESARNKVRRPISSIRELDYLPRRGGTGKINFYDLGQVKDISGNWIDLPFVVDSEVNVVLVNGGNNSQFHFEDFTLTKHEELHSYLFNTAELRQWKKTFRKVEGEDADKYGIVPYQGRGSVLIDSVSVNPENRLNEDNPEWSSDGLLPIQSRLEVGITGGLGWSFATSGSFYFGSYKVTEGYDYDLPHKELDMLKGGNVFIIPRLLFTTSEQYYGTDADFRHYVMFSDWRVKSRELFLQKTLKRWFHPPFAEIPIFESYYLADLIRSDNSEYMDSEQHINEEFAEDVIECYERELNQEPVIWGQHGTVASASISFGWRTEFPLPLTPKVNLTFFQNTLAEYSMGVGGNTDGEQYKGAGTLCAVIEQEGKFYYVWCSSGNIQDFWGYTGMMTEHI